jgi:hypothetical protein
VVPAQAPWRALIWVPLRFEYWLHVCVADTLQENWAAEDPAPPDDEQAARATAAGAARRRRATNAAKIGLFMGVQSFRGRGCMHAPCIPEEPAAPVGRRKK